MKTSTKTLAAALRVLAVEIQSEDGIANAAIAEAADRLEEQEVLKDLATVAFTRGEWTPEHKEARKKFNSLWGADNEKS